MAKKVLVYWRDIPAQVIVQRGRQREKVLLNKRFLDAVDRAAMRAGKASSDAYLAEWRRVTTTCDCGEDIKAFAQQEGNRLEAEYSEERLLELIRNHGLSGD